MDVPNCPHALAPTSPLYYQHAPFAEQRLDAVPLAVPELSQRHKSPNTTERYLRSIGMERVREALESLSSGPPEDAEVIEFNKAYDRMFGNDAADT